jgi:tRNA synthetases class I (E and Q), catalytic domain
MSTVSSDRGRGKNVDTILLSLFFLILLWDDTSTLLQQHRRQETARSTTSSFYVSGFAYAPNFITKIIQEDTGISPFTADVASSSSSEQEPTTMVDVAHVNGHPKEKNGVSRTPIQITDGDSTATNTISIPPVVTRFPPEPNGYLHLGHAKAISFNFAVARMFHGTCNMRMDDTNPSKEDEEYVASILEDVKWIQSGLYEGEVPWEGEVRKTSSYFDIIYQCAEALIQQGDAYVDSLSADQMREYRGTLTEPGKDSPYRTRSIKENMELFRKVRFDENGVGKTIRSIYSLLGS